VLNFIRRDNKSIFMFTNFTRFSLNKNLFSFDRNDYIYLLLKFKNKNIL